jgi:hypothetical protein
VSAGSFSNLDGVGVHFNYSGADGSGNVSTDGTQTLTNKTLTSPKIGTSILDTNGNELFKLTATSSAVNEITYNNAATGNKPTFTASGDDTNIGVSIQPKGSGQVTIDNLTFPAADGSADQFLKTDGSGNLSFSAVSGGTDWQSSVKTANFTAAAGEGYFVNTSGGAFEIDLPGSPSVGDELEFVDFSRSFATNNLTLDQGSNKFQGFTSPKPVYDVNGQSIKIVYSGSTQGWIPVRDDDVTNEVPQTYDAEYLCVAGGASGGSGNGGGGGAGGLLSNFGGTAIALSPGSTYTVTVGGGGSATPFPPKSNGNAGSDSSLSGSGITTITATGGGRGAGNLGSSNAGGDGGSGGGGGNTGAGGSGTSPQGNDGGTAVPTSAGGGGGAGGAGANGSSPSGGGNGGSSANNSITGSSVAYAGGGGGGTQDTSGGTGGGGGASNGEKNPSSSSNATANTGSGTGGTNDAATGAGGSGVVILRVLTSDYTGTTSGSPTVTTDGSDTVIKFTGSGSYTA